MRMLRADRGGIVVGWLVKLAVTMAVVGVIGYEAIAVSVAYVNVQDDGSEAARAAGDMWFNGGKDLQKSFDAAYAYASEHGDTIDPKSFSISPDGDVALKITKTANTLLIYRVKAIQHWGVRSAEIHLKTQP